MHLTKLLFFPIDFVHPKDRETFTNKITSTVMLPFGDRCKSDVGGSRSVVSKSMRNDAKDHTGNFFCRLRMYNSLKEVNHS